MGRGKGGCTGLGGGEGMLLFGESEAPSEELEVYFGEIELVEERFDIFVWVKVSLRKYENTEEMKNEEEIFLI